VTSRICFCQCSERSFGFKLTSSLRSVTPAWGLNSEHRHGASDTTIASPTWCHWQLCLNFKLLWALWECLLAVATMASWFFVNQPCMLFVDGEVGTQKDCNKQLSQYQGLCNSDIGGEVFIFDL
jgi:hypothetical protein